MLFEVRRSYLGLRLLGSILFLFFVLWQQQQIKRSVFLPGFVPKKESKEKLGRIVSTELKYTERFIFVSQVVSKDEGAIKDLHYSWYFKILLNSPCLKARAILREFSNITSSWFARASIRLLTYYMTENIANARALICTARKTKN